eukprot:7312715-Prymnesium_polylepis.1
MVQHRFSTRLQLSVSTVLLLLLVLQHRQLVWPLVVALMPILLSVPVCLCLPAVDRPLPVQDAAGARTRRQRAALALT